MGNRPWGTSLLGPWSHATRNELVELSPIKDVELQASRIPGVVSLAQGIPSFDTPEPIKRFVARAHGRGRLRALLGEPGLPRLREAIAEALQRDGMRYDPDREILVTVGSIEAIAATLLAQHRRGRRGAGGVADLRVVPARRSAWPAACRASCRSTRTPTSTSIPTPSPRRPGAARARSCSATRTTRPARCSRASRPGACCASPTSTTCWSSPTRSTRTSSTATQPHLQRRHGAGGARARACACARSRKPTA